MGLTGQTSLTAEQELTATLNSHHGLKTVHILWKAKNTFLKMARIDSWLLLFFQTCPTYFAHILCRVTLTMYSIIHRHRVHHVLTLLDMNLLWCNQLCNSSSWIMSMSHANGNKCVLTENLSDFTSLNILHHRQLTSVCLQVLGPSNAAWNQLAVRQTSAKRC